MRGLAMVLLMFGAVGCVGGGPYCDEELRARCAELDTVALCTLNGEEPEWGAGGPPSNGSSATCNADGTIACYMNSDPEMVPGCHCAPGRICD